jgi:NADH:ubiquinone oxidoreductase subunit 6 (subunit J)
VSAVLFFIVAIGALAGAIGVVTIRNPFYSVLALVFHLICLAALFLLLRAEFVAAAQVIVYAGAVMVLYVFVVAYIGGSDEPLGTGGNALRVLGPLFALAVAIELCIAMLGTALKGISGKGAPYIPGFGTPGHIGKLFLTTYLWPFEIASLLLLVAAIGAVMLARRRRGLDEDDPEFERLLRAPRPAYTGTMAEGAGSVTGPSTALAEQEEAAFRTESEPQPLGERG